ncbi:stage II sporulation protein GA (sporulation sigma-E factor processing peptidase) [Paenibacillus sp. UNCCL117]|uniref:sigma-E processing peptidase SpoIIGA n=1 Tax=unclassified Paenibacillus TaxID=185978 RepID=UPI0008897A1E|nr:MULTISPECIES: sigma-E processing peptidase SpoIIGA [unclassified Paenibacillus]SDC74393.1 stage II sporulation protein GA (sporulation sigma-E factor processing peptidase) [Paenibacillus sp. cl123]SFW25224.1 stage II sporulation protein GA (sporulation sigma-E factor processing peptidase) [Paenibacillus sp. UNCCL117]
MVVYLDIIFLMNVLIDGTLLWTTAWSRKLRFRLWRLLTAAAIGGSYAIFLFFPPLGFMYTFLVKFLFSLFMLWTAFGFGGLQHFLRNLGAFYMVNFVAAGVVVGCMYARLSAPELLSGILLGRGLTGTLTLIAVGIPVAVWIYRVVVQALKRKQELASLMAKVDVHIDCVASSCTGLIDTGNQLYDPLTRTPVMVMEASQWGEWIPEAWMEKIRRAEVDQIVSAIGMDSFIWQDRLRLVPYRGVNRSTQFMLALKPDKVIITTEQGQTETLKVLIGLDGGRLSSDNAYQAIIHPSLVQAGNG